jgi:hypothetical protein
LAYSRWHVPYGVVLAITILQGPRHSFKTYYLGSLGVNGIPARYGGRMVRNVLKKRSKSEHVVG